MRKTVLLLLVLLLVGCTSQSQNIRVGIITHLSGDVAFLGQNIERSAQLASNQLNYTGKVDLFVEDAGGVNGGKDAITAYRKLVDIDRVTVIIDGMSSDATLAVAPLLSQDRVVMITPLTGGQNIDEASTYLFRNGPSDILAGIKPAQDIKRLGYKSVALITDNAAYTLDIATHFRQAFNGSIVADETIPLGQTDYRTTVTKIIKAKPDAILILTADGVSSNYLFLELHQLGNTAQIFANFLAFNGNTLNVAGNDSVENVYVYVPEFDENTPQTQQFFAAYKLTYGTDSPIPFHSTGTYDALHMAVEAQQAVGSDGSAVQQYLLSHIQNWQGLNGVVSFDQNGNTQTGFVLKQIRNGSILSP